MRKLKTKVFNEEVLFANEPIVKVGYRDIIGLKEQARINARRRIRLCAHQGLEDRIHEMLIVHARNTYVRPHRHIDKIESFHIIEGNADIVIYEEDGSIMDVISMGKYGSSRIFYYRLSDNLFHTLKITSDYLVFHETTNGPFKRTDTEWASWAPEEKDHEAVNKFMENLTLSIKAFFGSG